MTAAFMNGRSLAPSASLADLGAFLLRRRPPPGLAECGRGTVTARAAPVLAAPNNRVPRSMPLARPALPATAAAQPRLVVAPWARGTPRPWFALAAEEEEGLTRQAVLPGARALALFARARTGQVLLRRHQGWQGLLFLRMSPAGARRGTLARWLRLPHGRASRARCPVYLHACACASAHPSLQPESSSTRRTTPTSRRQSMRPIQLPRP